jgi:von Willebrand factor type A domain
MNITLLLIYIASFCFLVVFFMLMFSLPAGSLIPIQAVHGQEQGDEALSSSTTNATGTAMNQTNNFLSTAANATTNASQNSIDKANNIMTNAFAEENSTTNAVGYSKYGGSTFSLQYPAGWKLERSDMGGRGAQSIRILNGQLPPAYVHVFLAPTGIAPAKKATQEEIESHIEEIFPTFVQRLLGTKNATLTEIEKPVYDKYTVDGHKVGSVIFVHDYSGVLVKTLALGTIVGNNDFGLTYTTTESLFDQNLPIIENMIKSVKFNRIVESTELNEKDFSLLYPKGWTVIKEVLTGVTIPAGSYVIRMSGEDSNKTGLLTINKFALRQNISQAQIDSSLEQNFPIMVKEFQSRFINEISNTSTPNYDRYVIDGHKAGSVLFTANYETGVVKFLTIGTVVGNNTLIILYSAPAEIFDTSLPVAEKIIKSIKLTEEPILNMGNVTAVENLNLNGIWKRADGDLLIITQQGSNVIASFPSGRANCEQVGLIGKEFESEFVFKGLVRNGKVLADNNMCYYRSLNQSQNGLFLDKANYTIMNGGTALEGYIQSRFSAESMKQGRYDKVGEIQPIDLNLKTDRVEYEPGQIVHFSGNLSNRLPLTNQTVLFQIFDPMGKGYKSQDVIINPDNSYSYDLNIKNDTRKGTFKVIATYAGFGDTVTFEYGIPSTQIPSIFKPVVLNNTNVTTIRGTPTTVSLFYNDGELPTANDVVYKVKFDVPNEKFQIAEFDKGTFDNVKKISNDTLVFDTARILKNESKTGRVVFTFDNNSIKDRKLVAYSEVTVNGTTEKTVIDPDLSGFLEIGTKIINFVKGTFDLGLNFYHQYVPCFSIREVSVNNTNPQKKLEIENCSNQPQKTKLMATGLPTFIKDHFNPRLLDIKSNRTIDSDLILEVKNNTVEHKRDFHFNVTGDVVYDVLGKYYPAMSSFAKLVFTLEPKRILAPPVKLDCSNLGKSVDSPELIQVIDPVSVNSRSRPNDSTLDNLEAYDKYLMQACVIGYDKINKTHSPIDVVFSIDSSPSMKESDKDNLRISAAKSFLDLLDPTTDKAGFITWGGEIASRKGLTSDFSTLKDNLDKIKLVGGTNLDAGLKGALDLLGENTNTNSNQELNRTKVIVFLSDGNGHYTRSSDPDSKTKVASVKGYKIFPVGLKIDNTTAESDLKDIATATGGVYYPSPVAENLNNIYNKIFQNIVTKEYPKDVDLIITLPIEGIKVSSFNIEPSEIKNEVNKSLTWKNISKYAGNKDKFLASDENFLVTFNIEGLSSNDNAVSNLNYTDTEGINQSVHNQLEPVSTPKPPLS